jgi:hypothetical protein
MSVRRGARSLALLPVLVVAMFLTLGAPAASASLDQATGGEFALYVPLSNVQKLGNAEIFVQPLPPAFLSFDFTKGPALHFPISGGTFESSTMLGSVNSDGGIEIQKQHPLGTIVKRLDITNVKILDGNTLIGNALGIVPTPSADLINATHSKDPATGVVHYEADAQMNAVTALVLNTYFDTNVFQGGWVLGHLVANIQTKPLL